MNAPRRPLPGWVEIGVLPLVNIALAFLVVGIIVKIIGVDSFHALRLLVLGAVGSSESIGYTLYYATNFIFNHHMLILHCMILMFFIIADCRRKEVFLKVLI